VRRVFSTYEGKVKMGVRLGAATAAVQLVLLAVCANASALAGCPGDATQPTAATAPVAAAALLCDVNTLRARQGVGPLRLDAQLTTAAQSMADDLAAHRLFSHVASNGETLTQRVAASGYTANRAGWQLAENLAWGSGLVSSPLDAALGWMDSAEHRSNLLDTGMNDLGIGIAQGAPAGTGESGVYYVADFGNSGRALPATTSSTRRTGCRARTRTRSKRHVRRHTRRVRHRLCGR
jgi:uncharacterized protein YkwD